ncbi:hypothetical protein V6N12_036369 [Hibiscus sabdariffa]|uniref:RNase H type-1 domain-containing protein n=1 Tax=Hibiscus sabdariffa TaxID=183260 RepID=A0ABR2EQE5_9ROSI
MRDCEFIQHLLHAQGLSYCVLVDEYNWKDWLAVTFSSFSPRHRKVLMVTFWTIWYARNKMVHEGTVPSIAHTLSFVVAFLRENDMRHPQICRRPPRIQGQWLASIANVIKLNFDAAFECQCTRSVSGVICRDTDGFILEACSIFHPYVSDAFQVEALACLVAVNFARDLGFTQVVIERDSLTVIKKCQSENIDASLISLLIADIKEVSKVFVSVSYGFVHREANDAAHVLAQEGKMYSSPMYWMVRDCECRADQLLLLNVDGSLWFFSVTLDLHDFDALRDFQVYFVFSCLGLFCLIFRIDVGVFSF